ncbi:nuclear transport factor 2 family protein [Candidatus Bipolaricaulota bacterium]
MSIVWQALGIVLLAVLLFALVRCLRHTHKRYYHAKERHLYSAGNASENVRAEIMEQLHEFQDGYSKRDNARLKPFMEQLFSQDNSLVLGTMPREVLAGHAHASKLVSADWKSWGDCTFLMDNAHVSAAGDVAWVSTIGYVKFDLSRFLVLPLRLSAVMVKEDGVWRFQFMQFGFDLDLTPMLVAIAILAGGVLAAMARLVWMLL